jgi:hypothetical protein
MQPNIASDLPIRDPFSASRVGRKFVSTQQFESQNEPEARTPIESSAPPNPVKTDGSAHSPEAEAEVQKALKYMQAPASTRWLLGGARAGLASPSLKEQEANHLLAMDVDEVLEVLRAERQAYSRAWQHNVRWIVGLTVVCVLIAKVAHYPDVIRMLPGAIGGIAIGGTIVSDRRRAAALAIARFDDVRAVGPLAEALEFKDKYLLPIASRALIRLLPRLQASDAAYLSRAQRACLNRALEGKDLALTMAILKAWEQVGDAGAIEQVQNLAEGRGWGGRSRKVVALAKECLPALRQSAERQQIGSQLLRPADGNLTPSGVLLRPAQPHIASDPPDQLLRPTDAD